MSSISTMSPRLLSSVPRYLLCIVRCDSTYIKNFWYFTPCLINPRNLFLITRCLYFTTRSVLKLPFTKTFILKLAKVLFKTEMVCWYKHEVAADIFDFTRNHWYNSVDKHRQNIVSASQTISKQKITSALEYKPQTWWKEKLCKSRLIIEETW